MDNVKDHEGDHFNGAIVLLVFYMIENMTKDVQKDVAENVYMFMIETKRWRDGRWRDGEMECLPSCNRGQVVFFS